MSNVNWRTINVDALDPDTPPNFPVSSLTPYVVPIAAADVQHLSAQIKQLLRGGDAEGALRSALENSPYGGDAAAKDVHLSTVVEILQSIKQADMTPMLGRMYASPGGAEVLDTLMKYLYDAPRPFPALLPSAFPVACGTKACLAAPGPREQSRLNLQAFRKYMQEEAEKGAAKL